MNAHRCCRAIANSTESGLWACCNDKSFGMRVNAGQGFLFFETDFRMDCYALYGKHTFLWTGSCRKIVYLKCFDIESLILKRAWTQWR